jgi:ribosomal protein S18 acetylase RimI-like enzyme
VPTAAPAVSGLRVRPWHRDRGVAFLSPVPGRRPRVEDIRACIASLPDAGYQSAVTPALDRAEQAPFLAAGLDVLEDLHLLQHDLDRLPAGRATPDVRLRRGRRRDIGPVTDIDHLAFSSPFWHLGPEGLRQTVAATPSHRFRVAWSDGRVVGYAVVGRSGRWSYLQRVAVHPDTQGHGVGRALVIDALRWSARRQCRRLMVNTQLDNDTAVGLYESLGFRRSRFGLAVLQSGLHPDVTP